MCISAVKVMKNLDKVNGQIFTDVYLELLAKIPKVRPKNKSEKNITTIVLELM